MSPPSSTSLRFHAALAKALTDNGIGVMFGVMGDGNLFLVDCFVREFGGVYVAATNEAGAAVMALGYASVSGEIGVATVTQGPGLTNTLTGLIEGVKGQTPMLLVCGDTAIEDKGNLQDIAQRDFVIAAGAGFEQVRSPRTVVEDVAIALRRARTERRPIALNVPINFTWEMVDYVPVPVRHTENRGFVPASDDLDTAIGIIATAKRPIILAGRGAANCEARAALLRLAERTDALLATTLKCKDLFRNEEFNIGIFGTLSTPVAADLILESDAVIAFGASLNHYTTSRGAFLRGKRLVQCNLDVADIGKHVQPDVGLVGDAKLVADVIVHWLDEAGLASSGFRQEEISLRLRSYDPAKESPARMMSGSLDLRTVILRLNEAVPSERICVVDAGRFASEPRKFMSVTDPKWFVHPVNFGSIGLGMSAAIGASYASGGRPILLVVGDGGLMLGGLVEFNTAVRCKIDLIVAVCNDRSYGAEHTQFRNRQMEPGLCEFEWPDFAAAAQALGGQGIVVRTAADLESAVKLIDSRRGPLLIDLRLDPDKMPEMSH